MLTTFYISISCFHGVSSCDCACVFRLLFITSGTPSMRLRLSVLSLLSRPLVSRSMFFRQTLHLYLASTALHQSTILPLPTCSKIPRRVAKAMDKCLTRLLRSSVGSICTPPLSACTTPVSVSCACHRVSLTCFFHPVCLALPRMYLQSALSRTCMYSCGCVILYPDLQKGMRAAEDRKKQYSKFKRLGYTQVTKKTYTQKTANETFLLRQDHEPQDI
jgi:hypothetical protein